MQIESSPYNLGNYLQQSGEQIDNAPLASPKYFNPTEQSYSSNHSNFGITEQHQYKRKKERH
jgi:hypothetical protein